MAYSGYGLKHRTTSRTGERWRGIAYIRALSRKSNPSFRPVGFWELSFGSPQVFLMFSFRRSPPRFRGGVSSQKLVAVYVPEVTPQMVKTMLASRTSTVSIAAGVRVSFYAVHKEKFPTGPLDSWKSKILTEKALEKYDTSSVPVDLAQYWVVDKSACVGLLGGEVPEIFFELKKATNMKSKPGGALKDVPAAAGDDLPGFKDLRGGAGGASGATSGSSPSETTGMPQAPIPGTPGMPQAPVGNCPHAAGLPPQGEPSVPKASGLPPAPAGLAVVPAKPLRRQGSDEGNPPPVSLIDRIIRKSKQAVLDKNFSSDDPNDFDSLATVTLAIIDKLEETPEQNAELAPLRKKFGRFVTKILLDNECAESLPVFKSILPRFEAAKIVVPEVFELVQRLANKADDDASPVAIRDKSLEAQDRFTSSNLYKHKVALRREAVLVAARSPAHQKYNLRYSCVRN